jgi:hypothetical protein
MRLEEIPKRFLDRTIIRVIRYIDDRVHPPREPYEDVIVTVKRRAAQASADYIEAHLEGAMIFSFRGNVWDYALSKVKIDGLHAEFGVHNGDSINHMAEVVSANGATMFGFDSFEGLKEDWRGTWYRAGHFDRGGNLPPVRPNVTLVKGWFDETVPPFLEAHPDTPFAFLHFDADTYETTAALLAMLKDRIVTGTVIVFDEYIGFPNWQKGEYLAWQEFVARHGLRYRYLAFSNTPTALEVL